MKCLEEIEILLFVPEWPLCAEALKMEDGGLLTYFLLSGS